MYQRLGEDEDVTRPGGRLAHVVGGVLQLAHRHRNIGNQVGFVTSGNAGEAAVSRIAVCQVKSDDRKDRCGWFRGRIDTSGRPHRTVPPGLRVILQARRHDA